MSVIPAQFTGRWVTEIGELPEAQGPAVLLYTVTTNKEILSQSRLEVKAYN